MYVYVLTSRFNLTYPKKEHKSARSTAYSLECRVIFVAKNSILKTLTQKEKHTAYPVVAISQVPKFS